MYVAIMITLHKWANYIMNTAKCQDQENISIFIKIDKRLTKM